MAVTFRKPVDDNVPWEQRLANYAQNPTAGRDEYKRALEVYRTKSALGDTEGANSAKTWMGQVDTAVGGAAAPNPNDEVKQALKSYLDRSQKPTTPFNRDVSNDPAYLAALRTAKTNSQQAAGNIAADMNKRGLLNSTMTADRGNQAAQAEYSRVSDTILPQIMAQKYQEYLDNKNQDRLQNQDLLTYVNTASGLNQNDIINQRNAVQDGYVAEDRGFAKQDRNINRARNLQTDYGVQVNPTEDYSQALAQVAGLKPVVQQKQESEAQKAIYEQATKQFDALGVATPEIAQILGIPAGATTQQARYQQGQLGVQQQNANSNDASRRAEVLASENKNKPTADTVAKSIESNPSLFRNETAPDSNGNPRNTGRKVPVDPTQLENMILNSGLPDTEIEKLYRRYYTPEQLKQMGYEGN